MLAAAAAAAPAAAAGATDAVAAAAATAAAAAAATARPRTTRMVKVARGGTPAGGRRAGRGGDKVGGSAVAHRRPARPDAQFARRVGGGVAGARAREPGGRARLDARGKGRDARRCRTGVPAAHRRRAAPWARSAPTPARLAGPYVGAPDTQTTDPPLRGAPAAGGSNGRARTRGGGASAARNVVARPRAVLVARTSAHLGMG